MMSSYLGLFVFFFCSNKFKDKHEEQVRHTYYLIDAKSCMKTTKGSKGKREDRHHYYQMIRSRMLLPCVLFCLLSSEGNSLYDVSF